MIISTIIIIVVVVVIVIIIIIYSFSAETLCAFLTYLALYFQVVLAPHSEIQLPLPVIC